MKQFAFYIVCSLCACVLIAQTKPIPQSSPVKISSSVNPLRLIKVTDDAEYIQLKGVKVNPVKKIDAKGAPVSLAAAQTDVSDSLRIVQLKGKMTDETRTSFQQQGYTILGYIPDNAYIVRVSENKLSALESSENIRWMGNYAPEYKVSPRLTSAIAHKKDTDTVRVRAFFPGDVTEKTCVAALDAIGTVSDVFKNESECIVQVTLPKKNMETLARIQHLLYIAYDPQPHVMNNESVDIIDVRDMWTTRDYFGSNETVAVADSGIDVGTTGAGIHADFTDGYGNNRITYIWDFMNDGANDPYSGHGTHVAGSVLGNGLLSGGDPTNNVYPSTCYAGSAPMAKLVFQALGSNDAAVASSIYTPADLRDLFQNAYNQNARIHQNSWGSDLAGEYNNNARALDDFVYNNPDMLVCFSAGNAGTDGNSDGVVDLGSIGAPGTAKNCVTVGASEGNRPTHTLTWGSGWPADFGTAPISSDRVADDIDGMAAFSSRGPCEDGRIKPDVVAPGTYIASTRTHAADISTSILWGNGYVLSGNSNYVWSSGTSMATPLVSGAAAVLRNYLREERNVPNPSAVLLKSLLLNGAVDMTPGQYGTGGTQEIPTAPNNVEGWGIVNLENTLYQDNYYDFTYMNGWDNPITTPGVITTNINVVNTNHPLNITLTWSDFMGSTLSLNRDYTAISGGGLVNDLDLRVIAPSGTTNYPLARNPDVNLYYYTNNNSLSWYDSANLYEAQQCSAPELPLTIDRLYIMPWDKTGSGGDINYYIWAGGNSAATPPGSILASGAVSPSGGGLSYYVIPVNVTINTRYFFIGTQQQSGSDTRIPRDASSSSSRSWYNPGGTWVVDPGGDLWMHAYGYASDNDHVNTVEGLRIPTPETGVYRIEVSSVNIPYPPVRYSVAVSGGLVPEPGCVHILLAGLLAYMRYKR